MGLSLVVGAEQPSERLVEDLIEQVAGARDERALAALAQVVRARLGVDESSLSHVLQAIEQRAQRRLIAGGGGADAFRSAATSFIAEALIELTLEERWEREQSQELVKRLAEVCELAEETAELDLYVSAIANPRLHELPPRLAIEVQFRILLSIGPLTELSVWVEDSFGSPTCLLHAGPSEPTRRIRTAARAVLEEQPTEDGRRRKFIDAVPVLKWGRASAALVGRRAPDERDRASVFLHELAGALAPLLERDSLLERNAARERSLVGASEKRLLRLGFDLHDGPLQEVVAMASYLRLARSEVRAAVAADRQDLVDGPFDVLTARLEELDVSLRELAQSLEATRVSDQPLEHLLRRQLASFGLRSEIEANMSLRGTFDNLTASQRIAIFRVVQEALTNVREHSSARSVHISLMGRRDRVEVAIKDDGCGFDVTRTLIGAARRGRLGLVGLGERIRLLGGTFDIRSGPGGPTQISVSLPRWHGQIRGAELSPAPSPLS